MISPWNICPLQATCGRTHRGKGRWAVRSGFQWHQDDWRRSQHQLHGKIPTVADSRRCSVCECVSVSGTVTVDLWFLQVEKTSDAVTPPLHLTVTYPQLSPRQNNLLYLTHVTTSPQVHKNTRLLYTHFYTHTQKKTSQIFLSFLCRFTVMQRAGLTLIKLTQISSSLIQTRNPSVSSYWWVEQLGFPAAALVLKGNEILIFSDCTSL